MFLSSEKKPLLTLERLKEEFKNLKEEILCLGSSEGLSFEDFTHAIKEFKATDISPDQKLLIDTLLLEKELQLEKDLEKIKRDTPLFKKRRKPVPSNWIFVR